MKIIFFDFQRIFNFFLIHNPVWWSHTHKMTISTQMAEGLQTQEYAPLPSINQ